MLIEILNASKIIPRLVEAPANGKYYYSRNIMGTKITRICRIY